MSNKNNYKRTKNRRKEQGLEYAHTIKEKMNKYNAIRDLVTKRKFSKALIEMEEYLEVYPDDVFAIFVYGVILINLKQYEEAKKQFQYLVDINAKNMYSAMHKLGCIATAEKDYKKAKEIFKKVIEETTFESELSKIQLATIEYENCNYEEAKKLIISIEGKHKNKASILLSKIEFNENNFDKALDIVNTIPITENKQFDRQVYIQKGKIATEFCNYQEANDYFEEAMKSSKDKLYCRALLGKAMLEKKFANYDIALNLCDRILQINLAVQNEAYLTKGQIYESMGNIDEAIRNYLLVANSPEIIKKERAYSNIAAMMKKLQRYDEAIEYFNKVKVVKSYYQGAIFHNLYIEIKRGNYKEAERYLNKALEENFISKDDPNYRKIKILIDKQLYGKISLDKLTKYSEKQYVSYNKNEAIKHVKITHCAKIEGKSKFDSSVIIEELMDAVEDKLIPENLIESKSSDVYYINYPNCGTTKDNIVANYIKIVTIPNTKDIITMYPSEMDNYIRTKELQKKPSEKSKVKRISQIDKFKKKYNLK